MGRNASEAKRTIEITLNFIIMALLRNRKTGVESKMTAEQLKKVQTDKQWNNTFIEVKDNTPKEVQDMNKKQTTTTAENKPNTAKAE